MSGDVPKKPGLRYSDSPHAPDWARDPALRGETQVTSFGQPIPRAEEESLGKLQELHYSDSHLAPDWARHPSKHKPKLPPEPDEPFRPSVEWFEELLWKEASDDVRVYAIMDGYWAKGLYGRLLASPDISWAHMFQGDVALNNIQDAPFIIALKRGHKLSRWLIEEGWGDGWGIYFTASTKAALDRYGATTRLPPDMAPSNEEHVKLCNLAEGMADPLWLMRRHFRRFSDVEFEHDARVVDFRYYDPASLRVYLPSCNNVELRRFIGPVRLFFAEDYCEVESLNQPHRIYRFAAWPDEKAPLDQRYGGDDPATVFEGLCYDAIDRKTYSMPRLAAFQQGPERDTGLVPMIRKGQQKEFENVQKRNFEERIIVNVTKVALIVRPHIDRKFLNNFIKNNILLAKEYSIIAENSVLAFVNCAFAYGPGFDIENTMIADLLKENKRNRMHDLSRKLNNLAKIGLKINHSA